MVERVRDPQIGSEAGANRNAKPVWHAFERANIVVRHGRIGSYLIDRFANVSRCIRAAFTLAAMIEYDDPPRAAYR
jgi:hypothetical protein